MRSVLLFFIITSGIHLRAQSFEGILKIDYKNENAKRAAVDVYVRADRFFIRPVFGGCERYESYIYDTRLHTLWCLTLQNPKVALRLNIDQILDLYEKKQLKPGYKIHDTQQYETTGSVKKIDDIKTTQKQASDSVRTYEIWIADMTIGYSTLIPVLRLLGFWSDVEDGDNTILLGRTSYGRKNAMSEITVVPVKTKVENAIFDIPSGYQQVDMDKFLANENNSPRFGELVKAFTGF